MKLPTLLTIFYYISFVPAGFILRLLRIDPMCSKPDPAKQTYWRKHDPNGLSHPMKYPF